MNEQQLRELMALPAETEWLEFKEAKQSERFDEVGKYFSALSNEANMAKQPCGWLILGITDKRPRQICGSNYCLQAPGLDRVKRDISQHTNHKLTFAAIHELTVDSKRVLAFEIPPAPPGVPTTWRQAPYGRIHESIGYLALNKINAILRQASNNDWSAQVCEEGRLDDLDSNAIAVARDKYKSKYPHLAAEVDASDDLTFLNKAKVTLGGKITRAAILLLGTPESTSHLGPAVAKMSWLLRDERGNTKDYEHFEPPFLLTAERLFSKIRNLTYRYLPPGTLFPTEVTQYEPWVIREALHNCIAHQDYTTGSQIAVIEEADALLFTNPGDFIPGSVDEVLRHNAPAEFYRNRFLADAMVHLDMIDTIGSGIRKMFTLQQQRFFPLPDYNFEQPNRVEVHLHGRILDEKYTHALIVRTDLDLFDVVALDKVQKGKPLSDEEFKSLKRQKLVEGRRPNLRVCEDVALTTETVVDYLKRRGIDKDYCRRMVVELLQKQDRATRSEFEELLLSKLSEGLDDGQKRNFVKNLLQGMRRDGLIQPVEGKRGSGASWELSNPPQNGAD